MPTCGNAAASTALPQPPKTSHIVPRNSADILCVKLNSFMIHLFRICILRTAFMVIALAACTYRAFPARLADTSSDFARTPPPPSWLEPPSMNFLGQSDGVHPWD